MVFSKCTDRTYGKKSEWGFNERDHLDTFILGGNYSRGDLISRSCSRARNQFIRKFRAKNPCVLHCPCFHLVGIFDYFVDHEEERNHASSITRRYRKPNRVNAVKPMITLSRSYILRPGILPASAPAWTTIDQIEPKSAAAINHRASERASEERRDLAISRSQSQSQPAVYGG